MCELLAPSQSILFATLKTVIYGAYSCCITFNIPIWFSICSVESVRVLCTRHDAVLLRTTLQVFEQTTDTSFHEIPSDPELRAKWLKVISRDDWTPNSTSCYSTVCSRRFDSSDFKKGCKIHKLKKDTVFSMFEAYPPHLQPPKKRERTDASVRKRDAAAPVNTPPRKRRAVQSQLETPSLPRNDLPSVDIDSQDLSLMDCTASELPLPLENIMAAEVIACQRCRNRKTQGCKPARNSLMHVKSS
ncbi:hypothetical protein HPB51_019995 [Rhipicephalus microplus]|uniref:THAP-type domain-containing protein n=1 Tax=Rhipicephalus microplus TaxID=6941 RepID=A0A9J6E490_RHIMP|nr:hypothetical protein HPB51_019995 [Rhipicephalus microplus]